MTSLTASNTCICWQNYTIAATLADSGYAASNMGVGNLQSYQGAAATAWQTQSGIVTSAAGAWFTITPAVAQQSWQVLGVYRTNLTAAATVTFALYNNPASPTLVSSTTQSVTNGQATVVLGSAVNADLLEISFNDPGNPDGFINIPIAWGGPAWFPMLGASYNSTFGREDNVVTVTSRGGQEYPQLYWQRRHYNLQLDGIRASETWADLDVLEQAARAGINCLFIPDITDSNMQYAALCGRLLPQSDVSYPYAYADRRNWRCMITERL